jgi:hypothetical protein
VIRPRRAASTIVSMRRLALLLVVALAVPALALAAGTDPKRQLNAADQRKAASIVLKRSDFVAGWRKAASTPDNGSDYDCAGYSPDQSDLTLTGDAQADFVAAQGFPTISSTANVYKTRSQAAAAWSRSDKPALAPCAAKVLKQEIEKDGGKVAIVKAGKIAFPKLAPRTSAYRIAFNVTMTSAGQTRTVPFTVHMVVLGHGRGDVTLLAFALGSGIPQAELRAFAKLSAARLAAAKL